MNPCRPIGSTTLPSETLTLGLTQQGCVWLRLFRLAGRRNGLVFGAELVRAQRVFALVGFRARNSEVPVLLVLVLMILHARPRTRSGRF